MDFVIPPAGSASKPDKAALLVTSGEGLASTSAVEGLGVASEGEGTAGVGEGDTDGVSVCTGVAIGGDGNGGVTDACAVCFNSADRSILLIIAQ